MATVSPFEATRYGFNLMAYFVWIAFVLVMTVVLSTSLFEQGDLFLGLIYVAGGGTIATAGLLGLGFKVIADGVARGDQS